MQKQTLPNKIKTITMIMCLSIFSSCAKQGDDTTKKVISYRDRDRDTEYTDSQASGKLLISTEEINDFGEINIHVKDESGFSNCINKGIENQWTCYTGEVEVELNGPIGNSELFLGLENGGTYDQKLVMGTFHLGILFLKDVSINGESYYLEGTIVHTPGHETNGEINIYVFRKNK